MLDHDSRVFLVCPTKRKFDFMITTSVQAQARTAARGTAAAWSTQIFSCDNWILFFGRPRCEHRRTQRTDNTTNTRPQHAVMLVWIADLGLAAAVWITGYSSHILQLSLLHPLATQISCPLDLTPISCRPLDLDPSAQSHSSHSHQRRKVGIKINQTSIHRPPYRAGWAARPQHKNSSNINQVIELRAGGGLVVAGWCMASRRGSLIHREYRFPWEFLVLFWSNETKPYSPDLSAQYSLPSELQTRKVFTIYFILWEGVWKKIDAIFLKTVLDTFSHFILVLQHSRLNLCIWWDFSHQNIDKMRKLKRYQWYQLNKLIGGNIFILSQCQLSTEAGLCSYLL